MITNLIESKRKVDRSPGGTAASVVVHAVLILLVAAVTAHARSNPEPKPRAPDVVFVTPTPPSTPPERAAQPTTRTDAVPRLPDEPFPPIVVPRTIPVGIPPVDLTRLAVDPDDFVPMVVDAGSTDGVGRRGSGGAATTYSAGQVEVQTTPLPGNPKPRYPSLLQSARVNGKVLVRFVVDTSGGVEMSTFRVVEASDALFADAVRRVLPRWKFRPAEAGGRRVRQLVQMPLTFTVR